MFSFFPFPKESDSFRGAFSRRSHDCASAPSWVWSDFHWLQEKLWVFVCLGFVVAVVLSVCFREFETGKERQEESAPGMKRTVK